jgi:putative pyruvate formate lyase activating enzyme
MLKKNIQDKPCTLCPRHCINRFFCGRQDGTIFVAKIMRHMWEEPVISGNRGSDAIFFSGCNLRCVFCQNKAISRDVTRGIPYSIEAFAELLLKVNESDAHSVSLITPAHFSSEIASALRIAREQGLDKTIIYNTNGYEEPVALRKLEGLVDVYLPDFKYASDQLAGRYSGVTGYRLSAVAAIAEMMRQQPERVYEVDEAYVEQPKQLYEVDGEYVEQPECGYKGDGAHVEKTDSSRRNRRILRKGVLIRHLVLPGCRTDSMAVIEEIAQHFPGAAVSLLRQYTPVFLSPGYSELNRKVTTYEYDTVKETFFAAGLREGFQQEKASAIKAYTPDFSHNDK